MLTLFTLLALVALAWVAASAPLARWNISAPMAFLAVGVVASTQVLDLWQPSPHVTQVIVEGTLVLVLFTDAARTSPVVVERDAGLLARLLLIALPLALALGTIATWLVLGEQLPLAACALIAAIVVPTDAALGQSIFEDPRVPVRVRRILGAESGLNDGIATPFVLLLLAFVIDSESASARGLLRDASVEIAIALGVAIIGGVAIGWILRTANARGWLVQGSMPLAMVAAAGFCYLLAGDLGGNGFIAAYAGGLGFGWITRDELHESARFAEGLGSVLSYAVWALFGIIFVGPVLADVDGASTATAILAALLALAVVRPLAVLLATIGSRLLLPTRLLMGWLGPRGLASVVFLLIATDELRAAGLDAAAEDVFRIVTWTVLLSVLLHGVSALPLGGRYARWAKPRYADVPLPLELVDEHDPRTPA